MAPIRPLRLKSERVQKNTGAIASDQSCVEVIVDNGVFHLDKSFTYLVPESFSGICATGTRVQVPFNGRELEGFVLKRFSSETTAGLKALTKVLTPFPVASEKSLALMLRVAQQWAAHPYDVIRSAIPPRIASVDKKQWELPAHSSQSANSVAEYLQLPPCENPYVVLRRFVRDVHKGGSVLILLPDTRSLQRLHTEFPEAIVLDSQLERTVRYENFLKAKYSLGNIVIGTRSAIFADIQDLERIVIVDEGSESFYEPRTPGWNVRDVALIRAEMESVPISFMGYSPSVEIGFLLEEKKVAYRSISARLRVDSFQPEYSELLPGKLIKEIKSSLKSGAVLVIAPRKGYAQGIQCAKCRNVALCDCGGRLAKASEASSIECSLCALVRKDWSCAWCKGTTPYLVTRGSARFSHEIGKAIPGVLISSSEGDHILDDFSVTEGIVVATPGAAPYVAQGYSAVVFLEAESLLSQADLRSQERARNIFFTHSSLIAQGGVISIVIDHQNPLIGALASWKPTLLLQRELRDRQEALLPPYMHAISIDVSPEESAALLNGLNQSRIDGRINSGVRILGPSESKDGSHRILMLTPYDFSVTTTELVHEYQRRRISSGKRALSLRVAPYSLSR